MVVSELVTNALPHGGGSCTLHLTAHPDSIEVALHDPGRHVPVALSSPVDWLPKQCGGQRVSNVLTDSARLREFAAVFDTPTRMDGLPPACTSMSPGPAGHGGAPETGGMHRVAIEDVSAWTVGHFSHSDH